MANFWDKDQLYREVEYIRRCAHRLRYPVVSKDLAGHFCLNPRLVEMDLESTKVCGMLVRGHNSTTIAVNKKHTEEQQNFYIAHELFHYLWHHDNEDAVKFCKEDDFRNNFAEWQANEAAAELIMPYQLFIPEFVHACRTSCYYGSDAIRDAKGRVAKLFRVTYRMVHMRLDGLKYEISQYQNHVPLEHIAIISKTRQEQIGIFAKSYNELEEELELQESFDGQFNNALRCRGWSNG